MVAGVRFERTISGCPNRRTQKRSCTYEPRGIGQASPTRCFYCGTVSNEVLRVFMERREICYIDRDFCSPQPISQNMIDKNYQQPSKGIEDQLG